MWGRVYARVNKCACVRACVRVCLCACFLNVVTSPTATVAADNCLFKNVSQLLAPTTHGVKKLVRTFVCAKVTFPNSLTCSALPVLMSLKFL